MNAQDDNAETPAAPHRRRRSFLAVRREESPGDASPSAVGLEDVAPEVVAPEVVAPEVVAPEDVAPRPAVPEAGEGQHEHVGGALLAELGA